MLEGFMTTAEAAKHLNRTISRVCDLCRKGELPGAERVGSKVWVIPTKSVLSYKPGPQGFAVNKARKEAEKARQCAEWNAAIRYYANQEQTSE